MTVRDEQVDAAMPLARALVTRERVQRDTAVDRALAPDGSPRQAPEFVAIKSPDGSVWRVRVSNSGTLTATKVV